MSGTEELLRCCGNDQLPTIALSIGSLRHVPCPYAPRIPLVAACMTTSVGPPPAASIRNTELDDGCSQDRDAAEMSKGQLSARWADVAALGLSEIR